MRDEDSWTKINYSEKAESWMKPLRKGNETGLVCIPANWLVTAATQRYLCCHGVSSNTYLFLLRYLDDLPPMM